MPERKSGILSKEEAQVCLGIGCPLIELYGRRLGGERRHLCLLGETFETGWISKERKREKWDLLNVRVPVSCPRRYVIIPEPLIDRRGIKS